MVTVLGYEVAGDHTALYAPIGVVDPTCPACRAQLDRFPRRKIVCPSCGASIHSRTRPADRAKVLVLASELDALERQWAVRRQLQRLSSLARLYESDPLYQGMVAAGGCAGSLADCLLGYFTESADQSLRALRLGLHRNARLGLADTYECVGRPDDAMPHIVAVLYLDINGGTNRGDASHNRLLGRLPLWRPLTRGWFLRAIGERLTRSLGAEAVDGHRVRAAAEAAALLYGQHEPPIAVDQFLGHLRAEMAKIGAFRDSDAHQNLGGQK